MKPIVILAFILAIFTGTRTSAAVQEVSSPDGRTVIHIELGDKIRYSVTHNGQEILRPSTIALVLEGQTLGDKPELRDARKTSFDEKITPAVKPKRAVITNQSNQLALDFAGNYSVVFRAYDDGVAYRFVTQLRGDVKVKNEVATFSFPSDYPGFLPVTDTMFLSFEKPYLQQSISKLAKNEMVYLPIVLEGPGGVKLGITESALEDYPGMFLKLAEDQPNTLTGIFAAYPAKEKQVDDRHVQVMERADYLAVTKGTRSFPWRLMVIADRDGTLIESDLVYRLAEPTRLDDASWIRPGKVAWDWWNYNNVYGVDFVAGVNTATYKYYIDFAAKHGLEYIILDEGWSDPTDLLKINPEMNMDELFQYAGQKKVGIILWVVWLSLDRQLQPAMDMFQKWGAKGIKVDFMDRDDQKIVNYYSKIAQECARRKMLVDFHGAYKPSGLERTYPNVITREGVMGLEYVKWSNTVTPEHDLVIPFTRMLAGPMDFTPGAMVNAQQKDFRSIHERPMSQGTRTHQLAMYVVYESPLQMLCDSPSNYEREPQVMDLLSSVPSVWDETRVLDAKVGDYVVVARRSGNDWYVGAMTDWTPRTLTVDLSSLGSGYTADIWQDGVNAARYASDYRKSQQKVAGPMEIKLAPGGGWVARLRK